jgi:hypothetical protein
MQREDNEQNKNVGKQHLGHTTVFQQIYFFGSVTLANPGIYHIFVLLHFCVVTFLCCYIFVLLHFCVVTFLCCYVPMSFTTFRVSLNTSKIPPRMS